jgi:hypothetical protein
MVVPWLKQLVAGFPTQRPGFKTRSGYVGFVVDKAALGRFSSTTSVSPATHSNCSILIIIFIIMRTGTIGQIVANVPKRNQQVLLAYI